MNRLLAFSAGAVAVAALAAGCGSSSSSSSSSSPTPSAATSAAGLHTANSPYGQILVNGSGRTLYLLTADAGTTSNCYGECASIWPPDTQVNAPTSGQVDASKVGSTPRNDNSSQVTYNGHPVYTYAQDAKPGDVNGQGLNTFGGTWWVLDAHGNPVSTAPSPSGGSSGGGGY